MPGGFLTSAVAAFALLSISFARAQEPREPDYAPIGATTSMLDARQMHGAAVLGDYLYVVGGVTGKEGYTNSAEMTRIEANGLLGVWIPATPPPSPRCYISNSTLALNDTIYVVGGFDNGVVGQRNPQGFNSRTAYWTRPRADGQLEPWRESPPIPGEGISCLTVVSTPGHLYVLGGLKNDDLPTNGVYMGTVADDGSIVAWLPGPPLPVPLWFHNAQAVGGKVWVWGGLTGPKNDSTSDRVYSSPLLKDGSLGLWSEESNRLPVPYYSAANASAGSYILAFCPRLSGGQTTTDVWFTSVSDLGLSTWNRFRTHLAAERYLTAAPDYRRGAIYIPGGRVSAAQLEDRTFFFTLSAAAREETEGPTTKEEEKTVALTNQQPSSARFQYTFLAAQRLPPEAIPGFLSYEDARRYALGPPSRPLMLYFTLPGVRPCLQQEQLLRNDPRFPAIAQQAAFAWVHVQEYPQLVNQLGVFRVPTWVLYDARGNSRGRVPQILAPDTLQLGIQGAR